MVKHSIANDPKAKGYKIFRVRCLRCGDVVEWEPKKGKSCMCTCNCLELTLDAWEQGYTIFADEGEYEDLTEKKE